ncbi:uncharacterized protein BX664DRAFT_126025 [Halteromyces radiatus]|uniref:uncharacterized protein n=1 Tax=Halteromyces radiatus TaxID=101107 RepID=UPI00221E518B|nr:uncharacterized protein BX664DRAFT_126025 [Halteromyces radiatus]KAI8089037.1 hypothetical protein BX664DRAFT_126025 [Halteromyces radiatus]
MKFSLITLTFASVCMLQQLHAAPTTNHLGEVASVNHVRRAVHHPGDEVAHSSHIRRDDDQTSINVGVEGLKKRDAQLIQSVLQIISDDDALSGLLKDGGVCDTVKGLVGTVEGLLHQLLSGDIDDGVLKLVNNVLSLVDGLVKSLLGTDLHLANLLDLGDGLNKRQNIVSSLIGGGNDASSSSADAQVASSGTTQANGVQGTGSADAQVASSGTTQATGVQGTGSAAATVDGTTVKGNGGEEDEGNGQESFDRQAVPSDVTKRGAGGDVDGIVNQVVDLLHNLLDKDNGNGIISQLVGAIVQLLDCVLKGDQGDLQTRDRIAAAIELAKAKRGIL